MSASRCCYSCRFHLWHSHGVVVAAAREMLSREARSKAKWVPHILLEGARFHVVSWDGYGPRCSEPRCEINKEYERNKREAKRSPWKRRARQGRMETAT